MTQIQKRIHVLSPYSQLSVGEVGYQDPSTIWMALDKSDWSEPMKIPFSLLLSLYHIETASISPTSTSVSVTYQSAFDNSSYFFNKLQVYKEVEYVGGRTVRLEIPYYDLVTTVNGFSLTLEEYDASIIITYFAAESSLGSALVKDYMYADGSVVDLVVPNSDRVQITGLSEVESSGITIASNEFTVRRAGRYKIDIGFATFNESASNVLTIDVMSDTPTALGITRQFTPRNDYDQAGVSGIVTLAEDDVVRFYLTAAGTGLTVSLTTITINIVQL